ncbi:ATP-binding protein [Kitasatospora indigofera]|uniref:ATP-binding protein n=1 Tax=Kitasatospora indigofera TaxID=67307 RepID=UPI003251196C
MTAEAFHPLPFVASSLPGGTTGLDNPGPAAEHVHALCAVAAVPESVTALRTFARALARRWLLPEDVEDALCLVVTELVTNVVLHSMSPQVTMYLAKGRAGVTAEVRDSGRWETRIARGTAGADVSALCGRGLQLVGAYATAWTRVSTAAGTRVIAHFAV